MASEGSEGMFERLTNHILESVEAVADRFEEGFAIVMTGKLPGEESEQQDPLGEDEVLMEMDEDMMGSPLEGIADGVLKDIMSSQVGPQTAFEHFDAFRSAITWKEPFILSLIAFQVVAFFLCIYLSRRGRGMVPRIVALVSVAILVRCAELMNGYAARNWESFATQNYFDRSGIFVGIAFCGPLLLDCFIMLTLLIREASNLLVEVKQMELKKMRQRKEEEKKGGGRGKKSKAKKDD